MSSDAAPRDIIIIADNDYIVRGILRSVLERQDFAVLLAVNGIEALDYAMRTQARLVILDFKMPRLDGFAACARMRSLPGYADVPIVILTAFGDDATREAARDAGATAFIAKPFRPIDLLRAIANLVEPTRREGGSPAAVNEPLAIIWKRRDEPAPLYGDPVELSEGRRILNICRR
jgi:DNA-binding response OmpR family regulator